MLPRGTAISVSGTVTVDSNYLKSNIEFNEQYIDVEIKVIYDLPATVII